MFIYSFLELLTVAFLPHIFVGMPFGNVGIIGTGALGGYYGALLARASNNVHFLLHSDFEHVANYGLKVDSYKGSFTLPHINAYSNVNDLPECGLIIIALKTTQNHLLKGWLPKIVKKNAVVLTLQNGLGVEEFIQSVVPETRVWGGLCFLCSNKVGPGHIRHLGYGQVKLGVFGQDQGEKGSSLNEAIALFNQAGIETTQTRSLLKSRWQKLVWNIPFNGLSVVLNADTQSLISHSATSVLIRTLMKEVVDTARALGYDLEYSFIDKMIDNTRIMKPYKTSMMLDYRSGSPMEIEAMYGVPLARAREAGLDTPAIETLYRELLFADHHNPYRS